MLEVVDHQLDEGYSDDQYRDGGQLDALGAMDPGPELASVLAGIDRARLNGHRLVVVLQALSRQIAHDQAALYAVMSEISYCPPGDVASPPDRMGVPDEFAADEIRAALALTRRSADTQLDFAHQIRERLPQVGEGMGGGRLDLARARVLIDGTDHLDEETARKVVDAVIDKAANLTIGQLRARLRRLTIEIDPDDAKHRLDRGVDARRVVSYPNPDGTANLLGSSLQPERVAAIMRRLNRLAQQARHRDDPRSIDQIRADIRSPLTCGGGSGSAGRR